jgi:hypothetical protein
MALGSALLDLTLVCSFFAGDATGLEASKRGADLYTRSSPLSSSTTLIVAGRLRLLEGVASGPRFRRRSTSAGDCGLQDPPDFLFYLSIISTPREICVLIA